MRDAANWKQPAKTASQLDESPGLNPNVDLLKIAFRQRVLIALIASVLLISLAAFAAELLGTPPYFLSWLPAVVIAILIAIAVEMLLLAHAMDVRGAGLVPLLIMNAIPVANLVLLIALLVEANTFLRFAGVRTSMLGVSRKAVLFAMRTAICLECGYNLTGNTSGRCPECGWELPPEIIAETQTKIPLAEPATAIPVAEPVGENTAAQ